MRSLIPHLSTWPCPLPSIPTLAAGRGPQALVHATVLRSLRQLLTGYPEHEDDCYSRSSSGLAAGMSAAPHQQVSHAQAYAQLQVRPILLLGRVEGIECVAHMSVFSYLRNLRMTPASPASHAIEPVMLHLWSQRAVTAAGNVHWRGGPHLSGHLMACMHMPGVVCNRRRGCAWSLSVCVSQHRPAAVASALPTWVERWLLLRPNNPIPFHL